MPRLADGDAYTRITVRQLLTHTNGIPKSAGTGPVDGPRMRLADFLPAGFLVSTAADMTHYLVAQLNGGRYGHASVLSPSGIAALHRPEVDAGGPLKSRYGMGWMTSTVGGRSLLWHDGSSFDMHTFMAIDPRTHWGVIVLFNGSSPLYELLSIQDAVGWNLMGMVDGFPGQGTLEGLYIGFDAMVLLTTLLTLRTLVTLLRGRTPSPPRWSFLAVWLARRAPEWLKWTWRIYSCALMPVVLLIEVPRLLDAPWPALIKTDLGFWLLVIAGLRLLIGMARLTRVLRSRAQATPESSESPDPVLV